MVTADAAEIGARVRQARKARQLTQLELASRVDVSESWLRGLEHGRQTLAKHRVAVALADALGVTVGYLYGQPFQPQRPDQDAGHSSVPAVRTALRRTGLILSGHPNIPVADPPQPLEALRSRVDRAIRQRQSARLVELSVDLPPLLEDLNTALLTETGARRDDVQRMIADVCHAARVMLNLLGFHDLAWTATECAALAAGSVGEPLLLADSAWNRCGALLHGGSLQETIAVAEAAMAPLEPSLSRPDPDELALWGALNLRCAIASGRRGNEQDAYSYLREATETAERLPDGFVDLTHQTVFSRPVVGVHEVELAVELGDHRRAVTRSNALDVSGVPSKERRTHHGIDVARAHAGVGRDGEAVGALAAAARLSPHFVHHSPMARQLVSGLLLRDRPTARSAGLGVLARRMGLG